MTPLASETELLHQLMATVPLLLPDVLIFQRPILNVTATARGKTWHARAGVPGQADAYVVARGGRHVELETKSARGTLAEQQIKWRARCRALDIPHLVLRAAKGEMPGVTVGRWVREIREVLTP